MLHLNDVELGILKPDREDSGGWRGDEPESPGTSVIPAYPVGRLHDKIKVEFNISDYKSVVKALRALMDNGEGVYFLSEDDPGVYLYNDQSGIWITNIAWTCKCGHINRGDGSIQGTVTTDHMDSTYIVS